MKIKLNQKLTEDKDLSQAIDEFEDVLRAEQVDNIEAEAKKAQSKIKSLNFNVAQDEIPGFKDHPGNIEDRLNKCLKRARQVQRQLESEIKKAEATGKPAPDPDEFGFAPNLLIVGPAGTGKTARIKQWAKDKHINLVHKDAKTLDPTDLGGIISRLIDDEGNQTNMVTKLRNTEWDALDTPDSVLFLDELNRAPTDVAGSLLTLIQDHTIPSNEGNGVKLLTGFLFTVAAANPSSEEDSFAGAQYDTHKLDMAMKTRFRTTSTEYDNLAQLKYIQDMTAMITDDPDGFYDPEDKIDAFRRYTLAKKLLLDPRFHFDSDEEEARADHAGYAALNNRTFTELLNATDGTKEEFLDAWNEFCNPEKYDVVEEILNDYIDYDLEDYEGFEDIDDKANEIFSNQEGSTSSEATTNSLWNELDAILS